MKRVIFSLAVLAFFSCKPKRPGWNSEYAIPLIKSEISISNIVNDSLTKINSDNFISLVYQQPLGSISIDSIADIPNQKFQKSNILSEVKLDDHTFEADITLGMIAQNWPVWGPIVISQNGKKYPLPDVYNLTSGPHPSDIQDIFDQATFSQGFMDIQVTNGFVSDVSNVSYELDNANSGVNFISHTFPHIASGATEIETFDLAGKTLEGSIKAELINLDILFGGDSILIDTSEALEIIITLRDLKIDSATAFFPAQEIVNENINTKLELSEALLNYAELGTATIKIEVSSTAQDTIYFSYGIPGAIKNGTSFFVEPIVPPSSSLISFTYDFSDYSLNLTGQSGTAKNTIYSELIGRIDSTDEMVTLSQNDSFQVSISIENITPSYVEGFLGVSSIETGLKSADFDVYRKVISGQLNPEAITSSFTIKNEFGINGSLTLNRLEGQNSKTNDKIQLSGSLIGSEYTINRANNSPHLASYNILTMDNSNSNLHEVLSIMPDKFLYNFSVDLNEGVDSISTDFKDFSYSNSKISTSVDMEIPLSMIADNLELRDTIELNQNTKMEIEDLEVIKLNIIVDNGFPLGCELQMDFFNQNHQLLKSLVSEESINAAPIQGIKVTELERSVLEFPFEPGELNKILNADYIKVNAKFNSEEDTYIKIYDDYRLYILMSGNFISQSNE